MSVVTIEERQSIDRANKANDLLKHPEFVAAIAAMRQSILVKIEEAPVRDREAVHELKLMLKLLGDLQANLHSVINTGKVIESRISMLERAKKGLNAFRS
jgi:hypothetical protein